MRDRGQLTNAGLLFRGVAGSRGLGSGQHEWKFDPVEYPWSPTGGRILTTLANEMAHRNARYGLISMCAAGAMAGAFFSLGSDEMLRATNA
jgi:hypothetical protein